MPWDFNNYYSHNMDGLISKLKLSKTESDKLKALRQIVRERTRDVFQEARQVAIDVRRQALTLESVRLKLEKTNVRYLSPEERADLARLILKWKMKHAMTSSNSSLVSGLKEVFSTIR